MTDEVSQGGVAFDRTIPGRPGELVVVSPRVRRIIADNPSPMTFTGTCTYVVGKGRVTVIDPGPDSTAHIASLLDALRHETVTHILVTHTHRDHSSAASSLKTATGAKIVGCAAYSATATPGTTAFADAAHDQDYRPDAIMREGDAIGGGDFSLIALATPGHTQNHLAFALPGEATLFTGDHVMAWSTSVIAPPDGKMRDYLASLDKLLKRDAAIYFPGHGAAIAEPQHFVQALIRHRRQREAAILAQLGRAAHTIPVLVAAIYQGLDPRLRPAAALSVLAHLEDLAHRGLVRADGALSFEATYRLC